MSVFGQVWVFSAAAFVLGALLSWFFLARPAQRRVHELQREQRRDGTAATRKDGTARAREGRTADTRKDGTAATRKDGTAGARKDGTAGARRGQDTRIASSPARVAGDEAGDDAVAAQPRSFVPTEADRTDDAGSARTAAPSWPEQDSLRGRVGTRRADEFDELDAEFARQDQAEAGYPAAPEVDGPTRIEPRSGDRLDVEPPRQDEVDARHGGTLFAASESAASESDGAGETARGNRPYPTGSGRGDKPERTDPAEQNRVLPKRQPGTSSLESFEQPKPLDPAPRPGPRREADSSGRSRGGSLFEPASPLSGPQAPRSGADTPRTESPAGPFGPGSAMPRPGGERPSEEYTVKASVTALRYCDASSPNFAKMVAEVWFRTPEDAERVGFRPLDT